MSDYVAAYRESRTRLSDLVRGLPTEQVDAPMPACPGWVVRDVIGHVVGIAVALPSGDRPGPDGPAAWSARLIAERRVRPIGDVLDEWEAAAPALEEMIAAAPAMGVSLAGDTIVHEQDVRGAVGSPGGRDSLALRTALEGYAESLGRRIGEDATLTIRAGDDTWTVGTGGASASVAAEPFEMFRALTGRRTPDQIRAFAWTGDPEPAIAVFSNYGWPDAPLVE